MLHKKKTSLTQLKNCLLLKGGHLIDPKNHVNAVRDIAIRDGKIINVATDLDPASALKTIDIQGLYVTPGLIDIHTHLFATTGLREAWAGDLSIRPDGFSFRSGITTMVDAGSSGWRMFETFRHAVPAIQQGFYPDSISTDLHVRSMNASMMDMLTVMSKFLAMGMPLYEVILRSTWNPARIIRYPELGHLSIGAPADVAVLKLAKGAYYYGDTGSGRIAGDERLFCEMPLKDGQIVWDWNARNSVDYHTLGPHYDIREATDALVLPPS